MNLETMLGFMGNNEAKYYLDQFKQADPHKFAVIKISGGCIEDNIDAIGQQVALLQSLNLTPSVMYGWGNTVDNKLNALGIKPIKEDGVRVTTPQVMEVVKNTAEEFGAKLLSSIEQYGGKGFVVEPGDIFIGSKYFGQGHPGTNTGNVDSVDSRLINSITNNNSVPIIAPIARTNGTLLNVNGDTAAKALALDLQPLKYLAITGTGAINDSYGDRISEVSLRQDYESMITQKIVTNGMKIKLDEAKNLLADWGEDASMQIIGPDKILQEILTSEGVGTRVRLGYQVESKGLSEVNKAGAQSLIENSFGEKLTENYFQKAIAAGSKAHTVADKGGGYKGIAIVKDDYLDVIATKGGNGIGKDLMEAVLDTRNIYAKGDTKLTWRTKVDRKIVPWYSKLADHTSKIEVGGQSYLAFGKNCSPSDFAASINSIANHPINFQHKVA